MGRAIAATVAGRDGEREENGAELSRRLVVWRGRACACACAVVGVERCLGGSISANGPHHPSNPSPPSTIHTPTGR